MKGFIEVRQHDESKILISVKEIKAVEELENDTFIILEHFSKKKRNYHSCVVTTEPYSEVVAKIAQALE